MAWGVEVVARGGKGRFVMQLTGTAYAVASARVAAASFTWARIRVCGAGCAELAPADLAEAHREAGMGLPRPVYLEANKCRRAPQAASRRLPTRQRRSMRGRAVCDYTS